MGKNLVIAFGKRVGRKEGACSVPLLSPNYLPGSLPDDDDDDGSPFIMSWWE